MSEKNIRSQQNSKATGASSAAVPTTGSIENVGTRPLVQPSTTNFPSPSLSSSILNGFSSLNIAGAGSTTSLGGSAPWPFLHQQQSSSASSRPHHANVASGSSDSGSPMMLLQFFEVISSKLERLLTRQETLERLVHDGYDSSQRSAQSNTLSLQTQLGERVSNVIAQSQAQLSEKLVVLTAGVTRVDDHLRRIDEALSRLDTRLARCEHGFAATSNITATQARGTPTTESYSSNAVGQIQQQAELMNRYLQEIQRTVAIAASQPNIYGSGAIPSAIAQNSALLQALLSQPYYSMYGNNNLQLPPAMPDNMQQQQGMPGLAINRQMVSGNEAGIEQHQQRMFMPQQYNQQQHQNNDNQLPASQLPAAATNYTLTNTQAGGLRQITHQQNSGGTSKATSGLGGSAAVSHKPANPVPASPAAAVNPQLQRAQQPAAAPQMAAKSSQGGASDDQSGILSQMLSSTLSDASKGPSTGTGNAGQSSNPIFGQSSGVFGSSKPFGGGGGLFTPQQQQQQSSVGNVNSQNGSRQSSANSVQQQEKAATPGASTGTGNKTAQESYAPFGGATKTGFTFTGKTSDKQAAQPSFGDSGGSSAGGENKTTFFGQQQQTPAVAGSNSGVPAGGGEKGGGFRLGGAELPSGFGATKPDTSTGTGGPFAFGNLGTSSGGGTSGAAGGFRFGNNLFNAAANTANASGGNSLFSFQMPSLNSPSSNAAAGPSNREQDEEGGGADADEQQQNPEGYVPNVDFQPIVKLEKLDRVVTGEEDEWPIFSERCKLFRFDKDKKEWKERGLGNIRLLKHKTLPQVRCVMRSEQVFKVRCNHVIGKGMRINDVDQQPAQKMWVANDYSENDQCEVEMRQEMFRVRFKTAEQAQKFQELFNKAVRLAEGVAQNADFTDDIIEERSLSNAEDGATPAKATPLKKPSTADEAAVTPNASINAGDTANANRRALEENVPLFNTL